MEGEILGAVEQRELGGGCGCGLEWHIPRFAPALLFAQLKQGRMSIRLVRKAYADVPNLHFRFPAIRWWRVKGRNGPCLLFAWSPNN
jgi:hypothetical protein